MTTVVLPHAASELELTLFGLAGNTRQNNVNHTNEIRERSVVILVNNYILNKGVLVVLDPTILFNFIHNALWIS